jgi:hypothetical protein
VILGVVTFVGNVANGSAINMQLFWPLPARGASCYNHHFINQKEGEEPPYFGISTEFKMA